MLVLVVLTSSIAHADPPPPDPRGPEEMDDVDLDRPAPAGYTKVTTRRRGFIIAGAITFGVSYGSSVVAGTIAGIGSTSMRGDALFIPFAGPFIEAAGSSDKALLVGIGLAQVAGAVMFGFGIATHKHLLVRNDQLTIAPLVTPGGLAIAGRF